MAKPLQDRIDNWFVRMQGEAVSPVTDRIIDATNPIHSASANDYINNTSAWFAVETGIRLILATGGITPIQYPFYLAFGREIFSLNLKGYVTVGTVGTPGVDIAALLKAKWVARGLIGVILDQILGGAAAGVPVPDLITPADDHLLLPADLTPDLTVTNMGVGVTYDFRIYHSGVLVVGKNNNVTNVWTVTPALITAYSYEWQARAKLGGVYSGWHLPMHSFTVVAP